MYWTFWAGSGPSCLVGFHSVPVGPVGEVKVVVRPLAGSRSRYSLRSPLLFLASLSARLASPLGDVYFPSPAAVKVVWPPSAAVNVALPLGSVVMLSWPPTLNVHCGPSGPCAPAVRPSER